MSVTLICTFVDLVIIKQPRIMNLFREGRHKSCQVILKANNANCLKTTMPARFDCAKLLPESPYSSAKRNCFKIELHLFSFKLKVNFKLKYIKLKCVKFDLKFV